jgi:predicted dehydrogenase
MNSMNRRDFIRRSGLTATAGTVALRAGDKVLWASDASPAFAAPSDRLRVGVIGIGMRAIGDAGGFVVAPGTDLVAAADVYDDRLKRARELFGEKLETTKDYRSILDRKDIDAVLIATPDHWHKRMIVEAMEAGKDVYCEKPMTYTIEEGFEIIEAEKRYNKILYVGSQWVSSPLGQMAKQWIDEGRLGQITLIKSWENRNTPTGAWFYPLAPDASEQTIDWKNWLGSAPQRPFDARRYFRWRCFWDYSGGLATDLVVHHLNTLHYLTNETAPRSVVAYGGTYRWKKIYPETEVPDVLQVLYEYPDFTYNVSMTLNTENQGFGTFIMGTRGTIQIDEAKMTFYPEDPLESYGWIVNAWPEAMQKQFIKDHQIVGLDQTWSPGTCTAPERHELYEVVGEPTDLHVKNFLGSVRTRKPSPEGAVQGHNAALGAHLANKSYREGSRKVTWDGKQARVI